MLRYLVIASLCAYASGAVLLENGDRLFQPHSVESRIVGSNSARIGDFPYQIAMLKAIGSSLYYACGGAIIKSNLIVSSAYCAKDTAANIWRARAESDEWPTGGQLKEISKVVIHNMYGQSSNSLDYDISLFFTVTPFDLSVQNASAVALPLQGQLIPDGSVGIVSGFGSVKDTGDPVWYLTRAYISMVNNEACQKSYSTYREITDRMICFGNSTGGVGPCKGDSGSPIVINKVLVGIDSWGNGCGSRLYPAVFTRISAFRTWIDIMGQ